MFVEVVTLFTTAFTKLLGLALTGKPLSALSALLLFSLRACPRVPSASAKEAMHVAMAKIARILLLDRMNMVIVAFIVMN